MLLAVNVTPLTPAPAHAAAAPVVPVTALYSSFTGSASQPEAAPEEAQPSSRPARVPVHLQPQVHRPVPVPWRR
jgi:hypothetical protein